jgi:protein SCO1/2
LPRFGTSGKFSRAMAGVQEFFSGWRFPVLLLFLLLFSTLALILVLVFPQNGGQFAQFAEQFRRWCLGVNAATGKAQWTVTAAVLSQPIFMAALTVAVWFKPLRVPLAQPRRIWPWATLALSLVVLIAAAVGATMPRIPTEGALEFPAQELRTSYRPPSFTLTDQNGKAVSLDELRGKPVLISAIYTSCSGTCPLIMQQAKRAVKALPPEERERVRVLMITLDPEHDTREARVEMARMHGVSAPVFRLLGGNPAEVNRILDQFGFERRRVGNSGVIDHANLFFLVDSAGHVAYRFTLGPQQERWLAEALQLLLQETPKD